MEITAGLLYLGCKAFRLLGEAISAGQIIKGPGAEAILAPLRNSGEALKIGPMRRKGEDGFHLLANRFRARPFSPHGNDSLPVGEGPAASQ